MLKAKTITAIYTALVLACLAGCRGPVLRPGSAEVEAAGTRVALKQPEDPVAPARAAITLSDTNGVRTVVTVEVGEAQDNTGTRGIWAKGRAAAAEVSAFMKSVRWLSLLGLIPLGLVAASFTPYGKAMGLSKEGKMMLVGAALFLFIAPAISKAIVDNALIVILVTAGGLGVYMLWERKTAYKVEAALRKPPPAS